MKPYNERLEETIFGCTSRLRNLDERIKTCKRSMDYGLHYQRNKKKLEQLLLVRVGVAHTLVGSERKLKAWYNSKLR